MSVDTGGRAELRILVGSLFLLLWGCNQPLEVTPLPVPACGACSSLQDLAIYGALLCLNTYGVLALLKGEENVPPVDENGDLNACLMCDEMMEGPGFQYSAGRIRRNSGIQSEIDRPEDQVYSVPHAYFD